MKYFIVKIASRHMFDNDDFVICATDEATALKAIVLSGVDANDVTLLSTELLSVDGRGELCVAKEHQGV